ncbi:hypothetical protein CROQUDRAFT_665854 [Cronartium quercuum f. sp. fusiforme G11]|uniref:Uncharacterized protein n=1 Tax=Cronartium quercuum f. sp. fusiforme G11 TaxID=708437 RepID=A0A9P6N9X5_9BASI|nr:hypothetical protein CROQUDRAFT_665854 [Cronartium quercuum f. sp. fusiforme G11]
MQTADPAGAGHQLQCQPFVPAVTLGPSWFQYSSMLIHPKDCPIWVKNMSVYRKGPFPMGSVIFISF